MLGHTETNLMHFKWEQVMTRGLDITENRDRRSTPIIGRE